MRERRISKTSNRRSPGNIKVLAVIAICLTFCASGAMAKSGGKRHAAQRATEPASAEQQTFPTAEAASSALLAAVRNDNQQELSKILGPDAQGILSSGDPTEDRNDRSDFIAKYQQMHRLVNEPDGTTTLYIGAENWPTPIPLVRAGGAWHFDTAAGKKEILYRRIGRNELATIQVCDELVDAEKEYHSQGHDGDPQRRYAQKFLSDPGKQDGLYWPAAPGQPASPIGALLAEAASEGYATGAGHQTQPFQGYYFRVLKGQGAAAPGGARSYVEDGKMTKGFAFLAYPADYRSSGVMTFIVDQDGVVYEKNLGPETSQIAKSLSTYDRNSTWRKAD